MKKSIKHHFLFSQPPEMVWKYLTTPDLMEQWLMKNDFKPVLGHAFQFKSNPMPDLNLDGIFHCQVLEIDPFSTLSYSWKSGPGNGVITLDSVVVWKLKPKDNGTELFLEHMGFDDEEHLTILPLMTQGWFVNVQKIEKLMHAHNS